MKMLVQYGFDTATGEFSPSFGPDGEGQDVLVSPVSESHSIAYGAAIASLAEFARDVARREAASRD